MNLIRHREAGKTSLATRMMGKEFREDVQSTEGVSMHLIKATVKSNLLQGSMWNETSQDTSELLKKFHHAVLLRAEQISAKQELIKSTSRTKEPLRQDRTSHSHDSHEIRINSKSVLVGKNFIHRRAKTLLRWSRKFRKTSVHHCKVIRVNYAYNHIDVRLTYNK